MLEDYTRVRLLRKTMGKLDLVNLLLLEILMTTEWRI